LVAVLRGGDGFADKSCHAQCRSPETSQTSALDFSKRTATANKCNGSSGSNGREDLEQGPGSVVQEEDAFNGEERAKEHGVRDRSRLQCYGEMVDIGTEVEPLKDKSATPRWLHKEMYRGYLPRRREQGRWPTLSQ
jgi:hypothetical protein